VKTTFVTAAVFLFACKSPAPAETPQNIAVKQAPEESYQKSIDDTAKKMLERGRDIFRDESFGSEQFWGDKLRLHEVIAGEKHGGTGQGLTPRTAFALGLRVDFGRVPSALGDVIKGGTLSFDDAENTNNLLKHDAVVGVKAFYEGDRMVSVGITCALCHSTTDDNFGKGIGRRLDGWPNRDLDVGKIVALAPNLKPIAELLGVDVATVKKVLESWGPGKYDAELLIDGKAFRPDGKSAATLIPAAFGLAGDVLECIRGKHADARRGDVLRSEARRCEEISRRGESEDRTCAAEGGSRHREPRGVALLPAGHSSAEAAGRLL